MGSYREALQLSPVNPNITATQQYRLPLRLWRELGSGVDQERTGHFWPYWLRRQPRQTWEFTEADQTISIGMVLKGKSWSRPKDEVGLAFMANGIGPQHRDYLAAGGLGFEMGDGKLNYGPERTVETYYNLRIRKGMFVTLDLQGIANPGNRDRGPIGVLPAWRFHYEF